MFSVSCCEEGGEEEPSWAFRNRDGSVLMTTQLSSILQLICCSLDDSTARSRLILQSAEAKEFAALVARSEADLSRLDSMFLCEPQGRKRMRMGTKGVMEEDDTRATDP
jgi:hypothetical protein